MEKAAQVAASNAGRKRRLISSEESEFSSLKTRRLSAETSENSASSAANCGNSPDHVSASCCSSNGSTELAKLSSNFVDLEEEEEGENEAAAVGFFATSAGGDSLDCTERREGETAESGELESTAMPPTTTRSPEEPDYYNSKMPSEAELEDFFVAAEKNLQKKFIDKYNFDIVKDQPLAEGRYEWVQIKKPRSS